MIDNISMVLAEIKVDEVRRSLSSVWQEEYRLANSKQNKSEALSKQVGRFLQVVGSRMSALGQLVNRERDAALETSLTDQNQSSVAS